MIMTSDDERRKHVHHAPDANVNLSYVLSDLWKNLGFLPLEPDNPGAALLGQFMLFELILKNSDSLSNLSLKHIKHLFQDAEKESDEDDDDLEDDEIDEDMKKDEDNKIKVPATPIKVQNG